MTTSPDSRTQPWGYPDFPAFFAPPQRFLNERMESGAYTTIGESTVRQTNEHCAGIRFATL